jgi:excisionase family DNA binding protein
MKTEDTKGTARISYGVEEAAEAIGLGRSTLYELMRKGTLRFVKVGTRRLIPADALRALLEPELQAA